MKKSSEAEGSSSSSTLNSSKMNISSSNRSLEETASTAEGSSSLSVTSSGREKSEDPVDNSPPLHRVLQLCKKNEWGQVDSVLRGLRKGAFEVNYCDVSMY